MKQIGPKKMSAADRPNQSEHGLDSVVAKESHMPNLLLVHIKTDAIEPTLLHGGKRQRSKYSRTRLSGLLLRHIQVERNTKTGTTRTSAQEESGLPKPEISRHPWDPSCST